MSRILIGIPEQDLATEMKDWFSQEHTVQLENNGWRILECLRSNQYDVIIHEIALPEIDAVSMIRNYRASAGSTPIISLAGRHCSEELQRALDAGSDNYLVRPFQLADLSAIVRALLRRPEMRHPKLLTCGAVSMDTEAGIVSRNGTPIHMLPMEYKLLQFFLKHPNQIFSTEALSERVWQKELRLGNETVRTHIRMLRQKLDSTNGPSIITTLRGLGYKTGETSLSTAESPEKLPVRMLIENAIAS